MATTEQVELKGPVEGRAREVLTPEALRFVGRLQREFGARREELLRLRDARQTRIDAGELPEFPGARVFMADFEDANSPTWSNLVEGQVNLIDAIERTLEFTSPEGKDYRLNEKVATLVVRPRGWHLEERHVEMGGRAVSGSLFDFGLYFFHNARRLL